jgi:hypothetical protein
MKPRRRDWNRFECGGFTLNLAYTVTFCALLLATAPTLLVFGSSMIPPVWGGSPRYRLIMGLIAGGHVIAVLWMSLVSFWVQRQERNLREVPKADLEEQLRLGERSEMLNRILWSVVALVWLGLAADFLLVLF